MPVDFAGLPCDYDAVLSVVNDPAVKNIFVPATKEQSKLGRILILSDAAHSVGANYKNKKTGALTDVSVFSFHAVKNLTTAEGGAIALNLPEPFDNDEVYKFLCVYTLHGQNKDALAKMQKGNWKYDIIEAGYKCNMTDLCAAIGLVELARYDSDMLVKRKLICDTYFNYFKQFDWAELPVLKDASRETSYHLFPLRIKGITESMRDEIMKRIFDKDVSVNVHFIPLPMLSYYKNMGFNISDYPVAYDTFAREITLPVFYDLTDEQLKMVCNTVQEAVSSVLQEVVNH